MRLAGGGGGGGRGSLSVIRSGFVSLRRDLLLEPALEIPGPPPQPQPAPGPSAADGSCLIYI